MARPMNEALEPANSNAPFAGQYLCDNYERGIPLSLHALACVYDARSAFTQGVKNDTNR